MCSGPQHGMLVTLVTLSISHFHQIDQAGYISIAKLLWVFLALISVQYLGLLDTQVICCTALCPKCVRRMPAGWGGSEAADCFVKFLVLQDEEGSLPPPASLQLVLFSGHFNPPPLPSSSLLSIFHTSLELAAESGHSPQHWPQPQQDVELSICMCVCVHFYSFSFSFFLWFCVLADFFTSRRIWKGHEIFFSAWLSAQLSLSHSVPAAASQ